MEKKPIYICGATASGKTGLAIGLAEALGGEVINGDAFQVYRGLEVLSAAPTKSERESCVHHLFGYVDVDDSMDAARYAGDAKEVIGDVLERGKWPIVVGGSGLYLKFLTHGIAKAPPASEEIRMELNKLSVDEVYQRLKKLDPKEAARQNSFNHRHLSRALEICLVTGGKASDLRMNFEKRDGEEELLGVVLQWERDVLADRIAMRTKRMLEEGAIEEVRNLPEKMGTIRQAIGVKEVLRFLEGELSLEECEELITISTRQYAKRQRNWFRRESWLKPVDGRLGIDQQVAVLLEMVAS